jgi:uncharacterized protein YpbB
LEPFLGEIKNYLGLNPRKTFTGNVDLPARRARINDSQAETLRRFQRGESVDQIARARGFVPTTIYEHLLAAIEYGKVLERDRFFTPEQEKEIAAGFRQITDGKLADVSALLGGKYDMGQLRIFRAFARRPRGHALNSTA